MPVDDLWFLEKLGPDKKRVPSGRHGRGKRWRARWTDPEGKTKTAMFDRKTDAESHETTMRSDVVRGTYIDPEAGKTTLREYAEQWFVAQTFDESTRESTEIHLRLHILPTLGHHGLSTLAQRPSIIQAWLKGLTLNLGANYVRVIFGKLSSILASAHEDTMMARNPCRLDSVKPPAAVKSRVVPWTMQRVEAVRAGLPGRFEALVDVGYGLGLRQGEAFGLSLDDIDWLRLVVRVRRQVKLIGSRLLFAPPKYGKERDVPLPESIALRLSAHLQQFPATTVTMPWREHGGKATSASLLFTSASDGACTRHYMNRYLWKPALAGAGVIQAHAPGANFAESREHGFHALRHTFASMLLADGVDIRTVAEYLGHSDPAFTLREYAHLMPSAPDRARRAIDNAVAGLTGPQVVPDLYPGASIPSFTQVRGL